MKTHAFFLRRAIELAIENVEQNNGGPFGAVIVKNGEIVSEATNEVTVNNDPTAHAEIQAIRKACEKLDSYQLADCIIYSSCEPCPMCLGAIYWARPKGIYFAAAKNDAAESGFDDSFIYKELLKSIEDRAIPTKELRLEESREPFRRWVLNEQKTEY